MLRLIPAPAHRAALRVASNLRNRWRRLRGIAADGVSVIATDLEGRVLLVRHSYGPPGWYFPGGGVHRGECPEVAARRELVEETACTPNTMILLGSIAEDLGGAAHTSHVFRATTADVPRADGREVVEARFFPTHSLPEPLSPRTRARLDMFRAAGPG